MSDDSTRYRSVRLDAVHYCEREYELAEKRRRRSWFDRNGEPKDPNKERLELFAFAVRDNASLGSLVEILKMPIMTLETCKADLARTVSAAPNLRYIDIPEGLFTEDPSSTALGQELLHRCPALRKIKYSAGSESNFSTLASATVWPRLKVLELDSLTVEADILVHVLTSFPSLHELSIRNMESFHDAILVPSPNTPHFPVLKTISVEGPIGMTLNGLLSYLSRSECRQALTSLSLKETKIAPQDLHSILAESEHLRVLNFRASVSVSFPISPITPLKSTTLKTLNFEILPAPKASGQVIGGYYQYLAISLMSGSLPCLSTLFAFYPSLPEMLLQPPKRPMSPGLYSHLGSSRFSTVSVGSSTTSSSHSDKLHSDHSHLPRDSQLGIVSSINMYTKPPSALETEWSLTTLDPPSEGNGRQGSMSSTRPLSVVSNGSSTAFLVTSRNGSVATVGNAFGGFLAVPKELPSRSNSTTNDRKGSKNLMGDWMGSE